MKESSLLTAKELATELRVSTPTIYSMIRKGKIPARRFGDRWRFAPADVAQLMEKAKYEKGEE